MENKPHIYEPELPVLYCRSCGEECETFLISTAGVSRTTGKLLWVANVTCPNKQRYVFDSHDAYVIRQKETPAPEGWEASPGIFEEA